MIILSGNTFSNSRLRPKFRSVSLWNTDLKVSPCTRNESCFVRVLIRIRINDMFLHNLRKFRKKNIELKISRFSKLFSNNIVFIKNLKI